MFDRKDIRNGMEVASADGDHVAIVDAVEGRRIRLTRADSEDGLHHYILISEVDRIEGERVLLKDSADIPAGVL